jgi:hypothetical protein
MLSPDCRRDIVDQGYYGCFESRLIDTQMQNGLVPQLRDLRDQAACLR